MYAWLRRQADGSCVSDNPLGRIRMGHSSRSHSSRSRTDTFKSVFSTPARLIAQRPASYTDLYVCLCVCARACVCVVGVGSYVDFYVHGVCLVGRRYGTSVIVLLFLVYNTVSFGTSRKL